MAQLNSDGVGSALVLQDGTVLVYGCLQTLGFVKVLSQRPMPLEEWFDPGRKIVVCGKALSAEIGQYHATIVSQKGELFTWGSARAAGGGGNCLGLGDSDIGVLQPTLTPQLVRGGLEGECVVQCRMGNFHTVALTETGRVFVFGSSISGQLGTGEMKAQIDVPQILRGSLEAVRVVFISAGAVHTVCTTDQGRMYTWGMNDTGQLGQGDRINRCIPTLVDGNIRGHRVIFTASSCFTNAAITDKEELFLWGWGNRGQLGRVDLAGMPDLSDCLTPQVLDSLKRVSVVACHSAFMIAVCDGEVWVWGGSLYQFLPQLAIPLGIDVGGSRFQGSYTPVRVGGKLKGHFITTVSCSQFNIVAITDKGQVMLLLHTCMRYFCILRWYLWEELSPHVSHLKRAKTTTRKLHLQKFNLLSL